MNEELMKDIEAVLNVLVRPQLHAHGGDVEVLELDDEGILWISMQGHCAGCPSADETAKDLIEKELVSKIPAVKSVEIESGISAELIEEALKMLNHRYASAV